VTVTVTKPDGWIIVNEEAPGLSVWSFAPPGHYAYPAVVRRTVRQADGRVYVVTTALCQADKLSCDRLMRQFQQLTEKARPRQGQQ